MCVCVCVCVRVCACVLCVPGSVWGEERTCNESLTGILSLLGIPGDPCPHSPHAQLPFPNNNAYKMFHMFETFIMYSYLHLYCLV